MTFTGGHNVFVEYFRTLLPFCMDVCLIKVNCLGACDFLGVVHRWRRRS